MISRTALWALDEKYIVRGAAKHKWESEFRFRHGTGFENDKINTDRPVSIRRLENLFLAFESYSIYFGLLELSSQGLLTRKLMSGVTTTCVCPIMLVCTLMKDLCMFIYDGLATTAISSDQPGYTTQLTVWLSKIVRVYRLFQFTAIVATKTHD